MKKKKKKKKEVLAINYQQQQVISDQKVHFSLIDHLIRRDTTTTKTALKKKGQTAQSQIVVDLITALSHYYVCPLFPLTCLPFRQPLPLPLPPRPPPYYPSPVLAYQSVSIRRRDSERVCCCVIILFKRLHFRTHTHTASQPAR